MENVAEFVERVYREESRRVLEAGADVLVAGNFVFSAADPKATIKKLKSD